MSKICFKKKYQVRNQRSLRNENIQPKIISRNNDSILKSEYDQLNAKLELINVKSELLKEFDSLREKYSALLKNNPENDIEPAVHRKRQRNIQMDKQMEVLKAEEDRLNEIR